jgi:signal transduction histidine kinase
MRFLYLLTATIVTFYSVAQDYRVKRYRVADGLPGDVVKAVVRDSLGFMWIATDDGLVKYDGIRFTTCKAALQSQYVKGFLTTRDNRLLAIGDLDVIEIQNKIDTVIFRSLIKGSRTRTDSTISYPRNIYQDHFGIIWLAEPQSLVKYVNGKIERYDLGPENHSPVFIRSFSFFENDDGVLFAISYEGKAFQYDRYENKFKELPPFITGQVSHVLYRESTLWIAGSKGLYKTKSMFNQIAAAEEVFDIALCSFIVTENDSVMWVTTYNENLYRIQKSEGGEWTKTQIPFSFSDANHGYIADDNDLWISTDKGVLLLQPKVFSNADKNAESHFIESIAEDGQTNTLYFCAKEFVFAKDLSGRTSGKMLIKNPNSYFQFVRFGGSRLWVSDRAKVFMFENEVIKREWDFSKEGNFIHDMFLDSSGNLWISQEGNSKAIVITNELEVVRYHVPMTRNNEVNVIREKNGETYVASNGPDNYLFRRNADGEFVNVSVKPDFPVTGEFSINDVLIKGDTLWMASSEGLLVYTGTTLKKVDFGERLSEYAVSSVELLDERNILFSNSNGLLRYDIVTGEFWLYDENTGLPSNTITRQGIFVDHARGVWIGTSYGIGYTQHLVGKSKNTPTPYCIEAKVNGTAKRFADGLQMPYGAFVDLQFTSITFPEKVDLQWRFADEQTWHVMENGKLTLTDLTTGSYTIIVRAKNLAYKWSEEQSLDIEVSKPYWQTASFIVAVLVLVGFIAWVSYMVSSHILEKRRQLLQNLVNERTYELQEVNRELILRNTELDRFVYSASHDLSAPLKSLMGLINVARMEKPGLVHEQYLRLMERSILKLDQFIREVVSYSRNSRMPLKPEVFNFKEFIENILTDFQYSPNFNNIKFIVEDLTDGEIICDATRLKIIMNNLVSNAIHFHRTYGNTSPYIRIALSMEDGHYVITVEDNGKGISDSHIHKIFDMFYRASEDSQGSGLGLYILKESVTKMDGEVTVTSKVDHGTTFIIKLPVPLTTNLVRSTGT